MSGDSKHPKDRGTETYRDKLIEHLSLEIDTHTKMIFDWRARASFYWLLGPFVLMGSVLIATRSIPAIRKLDSIAWIAITVGIVCFMGIGFLGARMEEQLWNQCNQWRSCILRLSEQPDSGVTDGDVVFRHRVVATYILAHAVVLILFLCIIFLIFHLIATNPSSDTAR